jgi:hypothetical protein
VAEPAVLANDRVRRIVAPTRSPELGAPILTFQQEWWDAIAAGDKSMEVRHRKFQAGSYLAAIAGRIQGRVQLRTGAAVLSDEHWRALAHRHCVDTPARRYGDSTHVHEVVDVELWETEVFYQRLVGQQGYAKYIPTASMDRPPKTVKRSRLNDDR